MDGFAACIEKILPVFTRDPRILALYLLWSAHSGTMRSDGDIDLALLVGPGSRIEALERAELAAEVAFAIGREVDLGEMSPLNLVYAREAILKGRRLFERDRGRAELREASLLGMYGNFFRRNARGGRCLPNRMTSASTRPGASDQRLRGT